MTTTVEVEIECPECESVESHIINTIIDGENDKNLKDQLLQRELNLLECCRCGNKGFYGHPILYHDISKRLMIWYFYGEQRPHDAYSAAL